MTWEKKRVTVVTKAYPEPSAKYGDVACNAGGGALDCLVASPVEHEPGIGQDGQRRVLVRRPQEDRG